MRVVFGGSFDPVHIGHLRMAIELCEQLGDVSVYLMPCATPPHKAALGASAEHRLAMLRLATEDAPQLKIDGRELQREGASYSYDSLAAMRAEGVNVVASERGGENSATGSAEPLLLVVGSDAAKGLPDWHRARELAAVCHVLVMKRPGADMAGLSDTMTALGFAQAADLNGLRACANGLFHCVTLNQLQVSSTAIRNAVKHKRSIRYLVTDAVAAYICDNGLYRSN